VALRNTNGKLHAYVGGKYRTTLPDIAVGDVLMIRAAAGCYQFGHNEARTFTLCNGGEFDYRNFYIDTAFKYGAADLGEFIITRK
jgi:hypothetical protein